jgi:hypothetical protein
MVEMTEKAAFIQYVIMDAWNRLKPGIPGPRFALLMRDAAATQRTAAIIPANFRLGVAERGLPYWHS